MGCYTQLIFNATLKNDLPPQILNTLYWMVGKKEKPLTLPDHPLFDGVYNPEYLLLGQSAYFPQTIKPDLKYDHGWRLTSISNIKNHGEIEEFLNWIKSYIESGSGGLDFYAIVCGEDQEIPTIYYLEE